MSRLRKNYLDSDDFTIRLLEILFFEGELTPYQVEKKAKMSHATAHKKIKEALKQNLICVKDEKIFRTGLPTRTLSLTDEGLECLFIHGNIERKHFERLKSLIESKKIDWDIAPFFIGDPLLEKIFQHYFLHNWGTSYFGLVAFLIETSLPTEFFSETNRVFHDWMEDQGLKDKIYEFLYKIWAHALSDRNFVDFLRDYLKSDEWRLNNKLREIKKLRKWLETNPNLPPDFLKEITITFR